MGCHVFDSFVEQPGLSTLYGEAGAGKTSLALHALKTMCGSGSCYYVSSEGLGFLERAVGLGIDLSRLVVSEAWDLLDLVEVVVAYSPRLRGHRLVVVDSVNYPYRRMAGEEEAFTLFSYILAYMRSFSERYAVPFLLTAQIHYGGGEGDGLEPVGGSALRLWSRGLARVERTGVPGERRIIFEKPWEGLEAVFEITGRGVVWKHCPPPPAEGPGAPGGKPITP